MTDDRRRSEAAFVAKVREVLDAPAPHDVAVRLAAARRRAVELAGLPTPRLPPSWIPVGGLAATLLLVGLNVAEPETVPLDDERQLATMADMDLLLDLEFAAWLDTDNSDAG